MLHKTYFKCHDCKKSWVRRGTPDEETCIICSRPIKPFKNVSYRRSEKATLNDLRRLAIQVANVALSECCGDA